MKAHLDPWKEWNFQCQECDWSGKGADLTTGDIRADGCEMSCPSCHKFVTWLEFPLAEEVLPRINELSLEDQQMVKHVAEGHDRWNAEKLKSVDQLPEINADYIVLLWDEVGSDVWNREIVLRHGQDVIYRQRASWEYYDFFIAACRILKKKYGYRLLDVVPSPRAWGSIHGDSLTASNRTEEMRRLIGDDCYPPTPPNMGYDMSVDDRRREAWENYNKQYDD